MKKQAVGMDINGAFGGYTAYVLASRSRSKDSPPTGKTAATAHYSELDL